MKREVNYEREYIQYLIENKKSIDTELLDKYFLDEIDFQSVIVFIISSALRFMSVDVSAS